VAIGLVVGFLWKAFDKFLQNPQNEKYHSALCSIASLVASLTNTVLFFLFFVLLFVGSLDKIYEAMNVENFGAFLALLLTFNAVIEAMVATIIGGGIAFAVREFIHKRIFAE